MERIRALIADCDQETRTRLKNVTATLAEFGTVEVVSTIPQAQNHLALESAPHILFISERFEKLDIAQFIKHGRTAACGNEVAYIILIKGKEDMSAKLSNYLMLGADGILCEPYSADSLLAITSLSTQLRETGSNPARERVALTLLAIDLINQIDMVAILKRLDMDYSERWRDLKDSCSQLANLSKSGRETYYDVMSRIFPETKVPTLQSINELGAPKSPRARKSLEKRIWSELNSRRGAK